MVKMEVDAGHAVESEENLIFQEKRALAQLHLQRYCFLGSFEPAKERRLVNIKLSYKKLNDDCKLVEPQPMLNILKTAYSSVLPRRDEVAAVHAVYLLGDVPVSWKTELRGHFPTLVKNASDLFMFCKYSALLHHEKKQPVFCKTIKKAITSWYKSQQPEEMAYAFGANRGMYGFTHRALIKLCRITDEILGTKYLYQSFNSRCKILLNNANDPLPPLPKPKTTIEKKICEIKVKNDESKAGQDAKLQKATAASTTKTSLPINASQTSITGAKECDQEKIRSIVVGVGTLRTTVDAEEALKIIEQLNLNYEQVPYHLLQYTEVLKTVVKSISCAQLIKCFHSEKIRKHFSKQDVLKVCRERFQRKGGMKNERVDPIMFLMNMDRLSIEQPLKPTNNKNTSRGRLVQFSKQLYRTSFREMQPTNLRIHITVNMQQNYVKKVLRNTKSVNYQFAAVALAFSFYNVEENCEVHHWTEKIHQLMQMNWNKKMDFVEAFKECSKIKNIKNHQRLYVPLLQANEKEQVYDLFIVIVPSAARGNKNHSSEMLAHILEKYRMRYKCKAKFVIVDLLRYKKSIKYSQTTCENILEICGLDECTIPLIYNFALNNFD